MKHVLIYMSLLSALLFTMPMVGQEVVDISEQMPTDTTLVLQDSLPEVVLTYPQILQDMPNVHVVQDSMITLLMEEKIAGVQRGEHEVPGYRVQIYSSNHPTHGKSEALLLEQRVKQVVSVPVYVIYASPSWKVRLGDFRTEEQAAEFRDLFKQFFPDLVDYTYIVRDRIKIR